MSTYADVATPAKPQKPEEARAPPVPEIESSTLTSTSSLVDVDSPHVSTVPSDYESQEIKTDTQADRISREQEAKAKAKDAAAKAKAHAKKDAHWLQANKEHPVVIGNTVLSVLLAGGLGYGAYVKYKAGEFSWKVVGLGVAVLGAFSAADYYVSKFLFQKYPPKK